MAMKGPDLQGMKCIYETVEGYHPVKMNISAFPGALFELRSFGGQKSGSSKVVPGSKSQVAQSCMFFLNKDIKHLRVLGSRIDLVFFDKWPS